MATSTSAAPTATLPSQHMQPVTSTSAAAVRLCDEAVSAYLSLAGDPVGVLTRAAALDGAAPLPHVLTTALFALSTGSIAALPPVLAARAAAAAAVRARHCSAREAALALAAEALCHGRWRFASQVLEARLAAAPGDALLLRVLHDVYFFLGDSRNLRDGVGRAFQSWEPTMPEYGRVCGMLAFGLEETGAYERAEELGMTALTLDPSDAWAVHAVTHVYEMAARREEGERLLRETEEHWAGAALFARHIHWHWALFSVALGGVPGYRQASSRYDAAISTTEAAAEAARSAAPEVAPPPDPARADPLTLVDATALLWRMQLLHHPLQLHPPLAGLLPPSAEDAPQLQRQRSELATAAAAATTAAAAFPPSPASRNAASADDISFTRWHDLAERWAEALGPQLASGERVYAFNDVHAAMALAAAESWCAGEQASAAAAVAATDALLASMRRYAERGGPTVPARGDAWLRDLVLRDGYDLHALGLSGGGHCHSTLPLASLLVPAEVRAPAFAPHLPLASLSDNWAVTAGVGADLAAAMVAFARHGHAAAFADLSRTRPSWHLVGGSHAQRDVFEQTLLFAAVGCGELAAARALAAERLAARPNDSASWFVYGSVLQRLGERGRAGDAYNRAYVLGLNQGPQY